MTPRWGSQIDGCGFYKDFAPDGAWKITPGKVQEISARLRRDVRLLDISYAFVQLNLAAPSAMVSAYDFDGKNPRPGGRQAARAGR